VGPKAASSRCLLLGAIGGGAGEPTMLRGGIERFTSHGVVFSDFPEEKFDCIILATGFRPDLRKLLPDVKGVFDGQGMPVATGRATREPGLFFCGLIASPTGQLREIGIEAQRIGRIARAYLSP